MEFFKDDLDWFRQTEEPLHVIIVGAGLGGLTAAIGLAQVGHHVTILEQARELKEAGAGIQVSPNAARVLGRLGVLKKVLAHGNALEVSSNRRYANDETLGTTPLMPYIGKTYGAPYCVIHRADLQKILLNAAVNLGVEIHLSQKIIKADPQLNARVQLSNGRWVAGDVVIAADGVKSFLRSQIAQVHGVEDKWHHTGDAAYRILIPREKLQDDPDCLRLLDSNICIRWMGPDCHIMAYPIKNHQIYNMVLVHPSRPGSENHENWTHHGSKAEMLETYKDWSPIILRLISHIPDGDVIEWSLNTHTPLPSWVENHVALLGDACHPQLPYLGQGAAQAIEDGGTITACFARTSNVPLALNVYQLIRKDRAELIQGSAANTKFSIHLHDGPAQEARDREMRSNSVTSRKSADKWIDERFRNFMWGADVMREVVEGWEDYKHEVEEEHLPMWSF